MNYLLYKKNKKQKTKPNTKQGWLSGSNGRVPV
jgi:hypothetical protein